MKREALPTPRDPVRARALEAVQRIPEVSIHLLELVAQEATLSAVATP
jgi:hypothetical protein